jgi:membrane protease YdiL (CAAX protease family)
MTTPPTDGRRPAASADPSVPTTTARSDRRRTVAVAVVIGAVFIGATLRLPRGSGAFYAAGFALASVWVVASVLCRPIPMRGSSDSTRTEWMVGLVVGGAMFGLFVVASAVGRQFSVLEGPIESVLRKADAGSVWLVLALALVNGVAEELFFRGALPDAVGGRRGLVAATAIYVAVTAVTGNTALTLAAVVMGVVFALERRLTGGLIASMVTHVVWSTLIIFALPR